MRRTLILLLVLLPAPAVAQAKEKEVFFDVGVARFGDDEGSLGTGGLYGGGVGIRPVPLLGFEFAVQGARHSRNTSGGALHFEGTPVFYSGNVLLHFPGVVVRPYVSAGLGAMHWSGSQRLRSSTGGVDTITNRSADEFAMNFGGGLKISVLPHLAVRPELRFYNTRHGFGMIQATIGLSLHW